MKKQLERVKKLREKFKKFNDFVGNIKVNESEKSTQSGTIMVYDIIPQNLRKLEFQYFLDAVKPGRMSILKQHTNGKKAQFKIKFTMIKRNQRTGEVEDRATMHWSSKYEPFFHATDLGEFYDMHKNGLIEEFHDSQLKGSGWELESIDGFWMYITNYTPFSSHKSNDGNVAVNELDRGEAADFIIEKFWRDKKGLIVPQNVDDLCFLDACAIAQIKPQYNPGRITQKVKDKIKTYNINGITIPPDEAGIKKFEKQNNIKIHCVCAMTNGKHLEIYKAAYKPDIILCLMKNPKGESHWCIIKDKKALSRLISSNISKSKRARHICMLCHQATFRTPGALELHEALCLDHEAQVTRLPRKRDYVMFWNERKKIAPAFTIYADFECYQPKVDITKGESSKIVSEHIPSGFGFYVKSRYEENYPSKYVSYSGPRDVLKKFKEELLKVRDEIADIPPCDIIMSEKDIIDHNQATSCYTCGEGFTEDNYKVRDYDHHDGHYRGALHNTCNLKLQEGRFIPIFFHNLKGYDSHLFINAFAGLEERPEGIPQNTEKFISFSLFQEKGIELRFLDSMAFMAGSLDGLAKNLKEFPEMTNVFGKVKTKDLKRKGVFPYEWFDSVEKLEQTEFPDYECFRSTLRGLEEKRYIDMNGNEQTTLIGKNVSKKIIIMHLKCIRNIVRILRIIMTYICRQI